MLLSPFPCHFLSFLTLITYNIVIVISRLLKRQSKSKVVPPIPRPFLLCIHSHSSSASPSPPLHLPLRYPSAGGCRLCPLSVTEHVPVPLTTDGWVANAATDGWLASLRLGWHLHRCVGIAFQSQ